MQTTKIEAGNRAFYIPTHIYNLLKPHCRQCGRELIKDWKWQMCEVCLVTELRQDGKFKHLETYDNGDMDFISLQDGYIYVLTYGNNYQGDHSYSLYRDSNRTLAYYGFMPPEDKESYRLSFCGDLTKKYVIANIGNSHYLLEKDGGYKQITKRKVKARELYQKAERMAKEKNEWVTEWKVMECLAHIVNQI